MNPETNHLVSDVMLSALVRERRAAYELVPASLEGEARMLLGGQSSIRVPRSSKSPLAKWAAEKRRKKRQMQRESRRVNRSKS